MLDLAILGLLRSGPRHGYDLKRHLGDLGLRRISFGSLYPALRRLEKRGLIAAVRTGGRRKAYRLTDEGSDHLGRLLLDDEGDEEDRRFGLRLAFFGYVEPVSRIRVLSRRRRYLVDRLSETRDSLKRATESASDRYTLALMRRSVMTTQADIEWLDELIAAERSSSADGTVARASTGGIQWETSR